MSTELRIASRSRMASWVNRFTPRDIVVFIDQDGLVDFNPDPARWNGQQLFFCVEQLPALGSHHSELQKIYKILWIFHFNKHNLWYAGMV